MTYIPLAIGDINEVIDTINMVLRESFKTIY